MQTQTFKRKIVAYAKFKEKDTATGKLVYMRGTRRFPIVGKEKQEDIAIQGFIDRTIRNRKSPYARPDLFCYIEDSNGRLLNTYLGGYPYNPRHKSAFRLVHLDEGKAITTLFSQKAEETDMDKAPWSLVNRYRPQRKTGNIRVYNQHGEVVVRHGKKLEWQDGKRKP